jgi:hypothetical protein
MPLNETELALARTHFQPEEQAEVTADNAVEKLGARYVELSRVAVELEAKAAASDTKSAGDLLALSGTSEGALKGWITRKGGSGATQADTATNYAYRMSAEAKDAGGHNLAAHMHEHAAFMHRENGNEAGAKEHDKLAVKHHKAADLAKKGPKMKSMSAIYEIDPEALDLIIENTEMALSNLVSASKITPAVQKKLQAALIGPADARNAYALSRTASKTPKSIAASVIDALKDNDPVVLGEKTKAQTVSLSRQVPGQPNDTNDEIAKTMDAAANSGRK